MTTGRAGDPGRIDAGRSASGMESGRSAGRAAAGGSVGLVGARTAGRIDAGPIDAGRSASRMESALRVERAGLAGRPDRGSATVLAMGVLLAGLSLLLGALEVIRAVGTGHQAAAAADLAALAAALERSNGTGAAACDAAARVAARNQAGLVRCAAAPDGAVTVGVVVVSRHPWPLTASANARAGPASATPGAPTSWPAGTGRPEASWPAPRAPPEVADAIQRAPPIHPSGRARAASLPSN